MAKIETHRPLIAIVGPTGAGKTAAAVELAGRVNGEIVSADSRQIYRGMDIATAKPTAEEQARARHHLIDIVNPDELFPLSEYQGRAFETIDALFDQDKQPLLVGSTGLYVRSVVQGLQIPRVVPNLERRKQLDQKEAGELYARLQQLDPTAAARILPGNKRRVIRALEVIEATGRPMSAQQTRVPPPFPVIQIGLTMPRAELYARIDRRIDRMIGQGLLDEVRRLVAQGYSFELPSMSSLGYREMGQYLRGEATFEEAIRLFKSNTRKFIRHQYNWFRPSDPQIRWLDVSSGPGPVLAYAGEALGEITG